MQIDDKDYQAYTKTRVMRAYNRMQNEGSKGVPSDKVYEIVMARVNERLQKQGKR